MKDVSSTSFGLLIAFLLPGLVGFYGLTFYSLKLNALFLTFMQAESNVGLFLLVTLASLAIGLEVTVFRFVLYERLFCREWSLAPEDFAKLGVEGKLTAFRAAVDETYRYHQFWGSMSIVMLLLFWHWVSTQPTWSGCWWGALACCALVEGVTIWTARVTFERYVKRAKAILAEVNDGKRLG